MRSSRNSQAAAVGRKRTLVSGAADGDSVVRTSETTPLAPIVALGQAGETIVYISIDRLAVSLGLPLKLPQAASVWLVNLYIKSCQKQCCDTMRCHHVAQIGNP